MSVGNTRAAAYVRISDDKVGDAAGVARQEQDCRSLAERNGWEIAEIYTENDTSAYHRRKVRLLDGTVGLRVDRPAFRKLLQALAAGGVGALVAYDLDRIARDPRDLEDLIDLVAGKITGTVVPTASVTGSLDLGTDSGITMARIMVALANKSSMDTGRRVTRKHLELAEQGKNGGGGIRAYGYQRDGTVIDAEAAVIRELAARLVGGESLTGLAKDLTARAVPTVQGGPWNARSVHAVVTKPSVAGLRAYRGEIIGPSQWPAILDRETWDAALVALAGRRATAASLRTSSNQLQAWLTGVLRCGRCRHAMSAGRASRKRLPSYLCKTVEGGCNGISISRPDTERVVEGLILAYFARPDVAAHLAQASSAEAVTAAKAAAVADEQLLAELGAEWAGHNLTTEAYLSAVRPVEQRLKRSRELSRAAAPGAVRAMLDADDRGQTWGRLSPAQRREVARAAFPDGITVNPADGGKFDRFDPDRLSPEPPSRG